MVNLEGKILGNYRLVKELGRGGSGTVVFLGQHRRLENFQVAIKVLIGTRITTPDDIANLQKEAQYLVDLKHPNIVTLYDFDIYDDIPFLVMEYASQGSSRSKHPKNKPVELESIVSYVKQTAAALQFAHDHHVIHCDVKPDNLLVFKETEIKLSDFGIAVIARNTISNHLHDIHGTLPYMAPEQYEGKAQISSDQYSLAVMVYEWLCGKLPFYGTSVIELYVKHKQEVPPPFKLQGVGALPLVEAVVMKALSKGPEHRFASIQAFSKALTTVYEKEKEQKQLFEFEQRVQEEQRQFYLLQQRRQEEQRQLDVLQQEQVAQQANQERQQKEQELAFQLLDLFNKSLSYYLAKKNPQNKQAKAYRKALGALLKNDFIPETYKDNQEYPALTRDYDIWKEYKNKKENSNWGQLLLEGEPGGNVPIYHALKRQLNLLAIQKGSLSTAV